MTTVIFKRTGDHVTNKVEMPVEVVPKFLAAMKEKGLEFERSKVVKATYIIEQTFEIPAGIDLEADGMTWGVKWNKLEIYKDGKIVAEDIEPQWDASEKDNFDWKRPDKVEIADDEEIGDAAEDDKDDAEEEDKKEEGKVDAARK